MSIEPKRLPPTESRARALEAARAILIESGPGAVTLKAVASRVDRTHANLLHHFKSAAGLQTALAETMAGTIVAAIGAAVLKALSGEGSAREVVDLTFDAFDKEGGGALASWMILSGTEDALHPVLAAIHRLVGDVGAGRETADVPSMTLHLVLLAMGDALLGRPMADALGLERDAARRIATEAMERGWEKERGIGPASTLFQSPQH